MSDLPLQPRAFIRLAGETDADYLARTEADPACREYRLHVRVAELEMERDAAHAAEAQVEEMKREISSLTNWLNSPVRMKRLIAERDAALARAEAAERELDEAVKKAWPPLERFEKALAELLGPARTYPEHLDYIRTLIIQRDTLAADLAAAKADNAALVGALEDGEAGGSDGMHPPRCKCLWHKYCRELLSKPHPGAELLAEVERLRNAVKECADEWACSACGEALGRSVVRVRDDGERWSQLREKNASLLAELSALRKDNDDLETNYARVGVEAEELFVAVGKAVEALELALFCEDCGPSKCTNDWVEIEPVRTALAALDEALKGTT